MNREYLAYVSDACKNGMTPEEMQTLFNNIYNKSNTRQGKRVLRLFAKGIGKAKEDVLSMPNQSLNNQYQYQYVKSNID